MTKSPIKSRVVHLGLLLAAAAFTAAPMAQAQALRPEVGRPLQAAQELMKAHKAKEALAKVREAAAVPGKSAQETMTVDRMMASVASAAGDNDATIRALESMIASGKLAPAEQLKYVQTVGGLYYTKKDYAKAVTWLNRYIKDGGTDPSAQKLIISASFASGDTAKAAHDTQLAVAEIEKTGRPASEDQYSLLANVASKSADKTAYVAAMEKLVSHYPKREYWADLLSRVQNKRGFSDRLSLDVYRLKATLGLVKTTADYMEMSQLALQAGQGVEAKKIIDQGYSAGVLGKGAEADRQKRLRDMASKTASGAAAAAVAAEADARKNKDGSALANIGYAYVQAGQHDKGLALMEQGIKLGGGKSIEHAKLHLGMALAQSGKKPQALQVLKTVQGSDGAADLARYWIIELNHPL